MAFKTDEERYQAALRFATEKHEGQFRIGGEPYVSHPIAVSELVREAGHCETEYVIAALFHDLLEDTDATADEIREIGGAAVLSAVERLTKTEGYVMADYMAAIKADPIALAVKCADRLHNLRCAFVASEDFKRRYICDTVDWYFDLSPEIREATCALAASLEEPMTELPFLYAPTDSQKQKN